MSVSKIVGAFVKQRRESLGLSQRDLGQCFTPHVTTQFISNIERGVTPLPPTHIQVLVDALKVDEKELRSLLEMEYAQKLKSRLGIAEPPQAAEAPNPTSVEVRPEDHAFIQALYDAYRASDPKTKRALRTVCDSMLDLKDYVDPEDP
jgi:transcriptional regulator with XRE-family HTH domain